MWYQELTNWLYFGGGAALLVILLVLMSRHRVLSQFKAAEQQIQHMRSEHEQDRVRLDERSTQLLRAQQIESAQEESLQLKQQDIVRLEAEKRGLQVQLEQMTQRLQTSDTDRIQKETQFQQLQDDRNQLAIKLSELTVVMKEKEAYLTEQALHVEESRKQLKTEFQNLAQDILEQKSQRFTETNKLSMDAMLGPFKTQIDQFRAKVEDIHHKDTQQQAELKAEMGQLRELNQKITQEAHELAVALKGQKKMQGNWGELVLENVLERSGLRIDVDYQREVTVKGSEGDRQRPDVVVFLPQDKHLIIDAKVSLNAYTRYVNAENDLERTAALKEHVQAFSARITELSDRDYFRAQGINSPEMVFMFVPIESAFVDALKADESLFQKAIEKNVLVATPTTLLTSLNIVRQLWRFENQSQQSAELVKRVDGIYRKLRTFLGSFQGIKKALEKASDEYQKAENQLVSGKGNLVKQAEDFKRFSAAIQGELPQELVEKASLEMDLIEPMDRSDGADDLDEKA
jgi:DNA recombination protein RmuC